LQEEQEEEKEPEIEIPNQNPRAEKDWEVMRALQVSRPCELCNYGVRILSLKEVFETCFSESKMLLETFNVENIPIFATENFVFSLNGVENDFDQYLRMADALLIFPQPPSILLLADLEADRLLLVMRQKLKENKPQQLFPKIWKKSISHNNVMFVHWSYFRNSSSGDIPFAMRLINESLSVSASIRAVLQVFLGETEIQDVESLNGFFNAHPEKPLRMLLQNRGNAINYDRSKLQEAAEQYRHNGLQMICS